MENDNSSMKEQEILYRIKKSLDNPPTRHGVEVLSDSELNELSDDKKTKYFMSLLQSPNTSVRNL